MPVFDILCLANSNKMRGSCIAGLRLDGGGWIRPVAHTPHGELYPAHYILQEGSCPKLLDTLRISFLEHRPSAHQPENWLIADEPWQLVSRGPSGISTALLQSNLAYGPRLLGDFSHRISSERFQAEPAASSLCVIRPEKLCWRIQQVPYNAHKAGAQFRFGGTSYLLSVTDPIWLPALRSLAAGEYPVKACGLAPDQEVLLTISLGDPWEDGWCYKIVAAILPLGSELIAASPKPTEATACPEPLEKAMDPAEAASIIGALARGTDPSTNEPLPAGSPLSRPDILRALRVVEAALQSGPLRKSRDLPAQAGKSWDAAEEEILVSEFESGQSMTVIARAHGRTRGAIKARLVRLGMIE